MLSVVWTKDLCVDFNLDTELVSEVVSLSAGDPVRHNPDPTSVFDIRVLLCVLILSSKSSIEVEGDSSGSSSSSDTSIDACVVGLNFNRRGALFLLTRIAGGDIGGLGGFDGDSRFFEGKSPATALTGWK